jgi:hypothetical protein
MTETATLEEDEAFLRKLQRPEEELCAIRRLAPWKGEFRWFKSQNIVCLEKYRCRRRPA